MDFLKMTNGAEGWLSDEAYVSLHSVEVVLKAREAYMSAGSVPWLVLFGTDGGGTPYAFDARSPEMPIVEALFPGLELDPIYQRAATFVEFLEQLRSMGQPKA